MRISIIIGSAVCITLFCGALAAATPVDYFNYTTYGGTWSDAEKSPTNYDDDYMCWAATAANILAWTGWGTVNGMQTSDDMFSYFVNHWTDAGGLMEYGWQWWLNGTNQMTGYRGWSQVDVPGGDFYPTTNFNKYYYSQSNPTQAMTSIKSYLQSGYGVGIGIYTRNGGHAITVWGIRYDDSTNQPLGIWVTDSDNSDQLSNPPDMLQYYDVDYLGGRYYLKDFYGTTDSWYIGEVEALAPNPGAASSPGTPPPPPPAPPVPPPAPLGAINWIGGDGAWETPANWDKGLPQRTSIACVDNGGTAHISSNVSARELDLGYSNSGSAEILGNGSLSLTSMAVLGVLSGSSGALTMSGGSLTAPTLYVGKAGSGAVYHNSGKVALSSTLYLGYAGGSNGEYDLQSGILQSRTEIIGNSGTGVFNHDGGTNIVSTLLNINNGSYNMGHAALNAGNVTVGPYGRFNLTDSAAAVRLTGLLTFSDGAIYNAVAGSRIVMAGGSVSITTSWQANLAGLSNTEFVFDGGGRLSQFSLLDLLNFGLGSDFTVGKLTVGDASGLGRLRLVDPYNSGFFRLYGLDDLTLNALSITKGSYLDLNGFNIALPGNWAGTLDSWIADRRLRDSSLGTSYYLDAVYANSWTTVEAYLRPSAARSSKTKSSGAASDMTSDSPIVTGDSQPVPEPTSLAMLCFGIAALGGTILRKMRRLAVRRKYCNVGQ